MTFQNAPAESVESSTGWAGNLGTLRKKPRRSGASFECHHAGLLGRGEPPRRPSKPATPYTRKAATATLRARGRREAVGNGIDALLPFSGMTLAPYSCGGTHMKSYEGRSPTPLRHKLLRAVLLLSLILVGGFYIYGTSSNSSGQHTQAALDEITLARLAHTTPQTPVTRSAQMSELRGANRANEHSQKMLNMTENQRNAY